MIKALLLIFTPVGAWDRIAYARRGVLFILFLYLLPLLVLSSLGEAYRLVHWGMMQGTTIPHPKTFTLAETVVIEAGQLLLSIGVVFIGGALLKAVGETFHGRHTYKQAFATVAYGLSPLFVLRLLEAFKDISPWMSWALGFLLSIRVLYHGVPRVMDPDPAHAFGLFLMTTLLLLLTTGLAELMVAAYMQGRFPKLEPLVSGLAARLPF